MRAKERGLFLLLAVVAIASQVSLETLEHPQHDEPESYDATTFFNIITKQPAPAGNAPASADVTDDNTSSGRVRRHRTVIAHAQPRPRLYHPHDQKNNLATFDDAEQQNEPRNSHETAKEAALSAINAISVFERSVQHGHNSLPGFGSDFLPIDSQPSSKVAVSQPQPVRVQENVQVERSNQSPDDDLRLEDGDQQNDGADPANSAIGRLRFRLNELISKQQKRKDIQLIDGQVKSDTGSSGASGCECSTNGKSGGILVPYTGCAKHIPDNPTFCYVSVPIACKEFARPSTDYPGASWRFCDVASTSDGSSSAEEPDTNTKIGHSAEDGYHKYTLSHSGVKTTLITEGNQTLTPEQGRKRSEEIINKVKADQTVENKNLTDTLNNTQQMTQKTIEEAYSTIGDTLSSVMGAVDTALHDALQTANDDTKAAKPTASPEPLTYESLYKKIEDRIMNHTRHLQAPPLDKKGNVLPKVERDDPTETLFDRMMKMSDRIVGNVDRKLKAVADRMANSTSSSSYSGPVSVSATTSG